MARYRPPMSIRKLLGLMVALAVLFAPSLAAAAERGMTMANHEVQMMEMGRCQSPPSGHGHQDKNAGHSCCISMCMGVAITPAAPMAEAFRPHATLTFELSTLHLPELVEIATPPPRRS